MNNCGIGSFLDTGWVAGYLLIGLGALRAVYLPSTEATEPRGTALSLVAPYVPVLAVLVVTAIETILGHRLESVAWIMVLALAVLVLGRQLLVLWDRAAFERRLSEDDGPSNDSTPTRDVTHTVLSGR